MQHNTCDITHASVTYMWHEQQTVAPEVLRASNVDLCAMATVTSSHSTVVRNACAIFAVERVDCTDARPALARME